MKRVLSILLFSIVVFTFSSCGDKAQSDNNAGTDRQSDTTTETNAADHSLQDSDTTLQDGSDSTAGTGYQIARKPSVYHVMETLLFPTINDLYPSIWVMNPEGQVVNCTTKTLGFNYRIKYYYTYNQEGYIEKVVSEIQDSNKKTAEWNYEYEYGLDMLPVNVTATLDGPQLLAEQGEGDTQYISYTYNDFQKPSEITVRYEENGNSIKTMYASLSYNEKEQLDSVSFYYDISQEYVQVIKYVYYDDGSLCEIKSVRYQVQYPGEDYGVLNFDTNGNIVSYTAPSDEKTSGYFEYDLNGNMTHYYMNYFIINDKYQTDERTFNNDNISVDEYGNLINEDDLDF